MRLTEVLCSNTIVLSTSVEGLLESAGAESENAVLLHRNAVKQHVYLFYLIISQADDASVDPATMEEKGY